MQGKRLEQKSMKAALFDMDGVIIDSMPYHVKAWQKALAEIGLSAPAELIYLHEGAIEPETAVQIFCDNGCKIDEKGFHKLFKRQREIFSNHYQKEVKLYDGAEKILSELKNRGWKIALVTSSHREVLEKVLPIHVFNLMDYVVTGDEVKRRKPNPDPYLTGLAGLNVNPSQSVVVENAPAGIRAAKAAGLKCIALTTTLSPEYLKEADEILSDHNELITYFLKNHSSS